MKSGERLSPAEAGRAAADGANRRSGGIAATLGLEAGVLDLFGWLRGKDGRRDDAPAPARRSIAQPVKGPMFTGRVEPMNFQRAPRAGARAGRSGAGATGQRARPDGGRQPRARQNPTKATASAIRARTAFSPRTASRRASPAARWCKGVSLYVRRGEAVGLLGPNGAGKTTVFYMITGLIKADSGRIELDGHDITHLPMYQRARLGIGYLPQEASIFRGLNVEDNIRAVLEVVEPSQQAARARARRAARGVQHRAAAQDAVDRAVGRRAPPRRDRARARDAADLHAARRAVRRHRSDRGRRHPGSWCAT